MSALHIYWHSTYIGMVYMLVWCKINLLVLILKISSSNVGECSIGNRLPSLMELVIEPFREFYSLEKHSLCSFGLFYNFWGIFIISCLEKWRLHLGDYIYYGFWVEKTHTTATLHWISAKILMCTPIAIKLNYLYQPIRAQLLLIKALL